MDWLNAPTHTGLWWCWSPGTARPEIARVVKVTDWTGERYAAECIGMEDKVWLTSFKPGCKWRRAEVPAPPQ
jgi:hypothetical protein